MRVNTRQSYCLDNQAPILFTKPFSDQFPALLLAKLKDLVILINVLQTTNSGPGKHTNINADNT